MCHLYELLHKQYGISEVASHILWEQKTYKLGWD